MIINKLMKQNTFEEFIVRQFVLNRIFYMSSISYDYESDEMTLQSYLP